MLPDDKFPFVLQSLSWLCGRCAAPFIIFCLQFTSQLVSFGYWTLITLRRMKPVYTNEFTAFTGEHNWDTLFDETFWNQIFHSVIHVHQERFETSFLGCTKTKQRQQSRFSGTIVRTGFRLKISCESRIYSHRFSLQIVVVLFATDQLSL